MSFSASWGYLDPTNEYGVAVDQNESGSIIRIEDKEFHIPIRPSALITKMIDDDAPGSNLPGALIRLVITSDYESKSTALVRYIASAFREMNLKYTISNICNHLLRSVKF